MKNNITFSRNTMTMTTVEIAERTGKQHKHVLRDTKKMLIELYGEYSLPKFGQWYKADNGQTYECFALPKNDVLTLISGYSIPLRAKIIRRLDELENNKFNFQACGHKTEEFELQMIGLKYCADMLNYSESSKLELIHAVHENNGVPTASLPIYTENVRVTFSAKDLLNKNNCKISPIKFNQRMIELGFLKEKERSSTKGKNGVKKFKALTDKGLEYGQNDTSKHNPRETQPHYFENTFMELFGLLFEVKVAV